MQPGRINTRPKVEQNGYTTHWMNREKSAIKENVASKLCSQ
jgi:hypothetical protein